MLRRLKAPVLFLALLQVLCFAAAQDEVHSFHGGVRAGFVASQISGDDLVGFNQLGASAGIFVNRAIIPSGKLKLQLELDFTMKGSHSKASKSNQTNNFYALNIWYVEMPLLLEWSVGNWTLWGRSFRFILEAGPTFGVNVYQREREATGIIVGRPQFRRFEFSALAGISLMISDKHSVNFRYSNSIVPVRIPNWAYDRAIMKQFNSLITFSYAYTF